MPTLAVLQLVAAAVGFLVAWNTPVGAWVVFLCLLGPFSSLPWHLGFSNAGFALPFLLGCVLAPRSRSAADRPPMAGLRVSVYLYGTCLAVSTVLALGRATPLGEIDDVVRTVFAGALVTFNPGEQAGIVQSMLIALVGPLVFLRAVGDLRERTLDTIRLGLVGSLVVAVGSIVLQALFLDPTVRPDLGRTEGLGVTGIVGFFQDPHSLAAYLLLLWVVVLGELLRRARLGHERRAGLLGLLLTAAFVCLIFTNSRGGFLAFGGAVLCLVGLRTAAGSEGHDDGLDTSASEARERGEPRGMSARADRFAVAVAVVLVIGLLLVPPVQQAVATGLRWVGAARLAELFTADYTLLPAARTRLMAWRIGAGATLSFPLVGLGPLELTRLMASSLPADALAAGIHRHNLHNHFLQVSSVYGIPALIGFITVVLAAIGRPVRALLCRGVPSATELTFLSGIVAGQMGVMLLCLVSHPLLVVEIQGFYWLVAAYGVASTLNVGRHE